jgi:hypothetical protein
MCTVVLAKRDGDFGAREVGHALAAGRGGGAVLAADFVVVGQGPQLHPVGLGARGQVFGVPGFRRIRRSGSAGRR